MSLGIEFRKARIVAILEHVKQQLQRSADRISTTRAQFDEAYLEMLANKGAQGEGDWTQAEVQEAIADLVAVRDAVISQIEAALNAPLPTPPPLG